MTRNDWTVPETAVIQRIGDSLRADDPDETVLATIVDVEGNAYRRPGAKVLFDATGDGVGSVTAGCLEDELRAVAETVRESGRPERVTYDMMEDDDVWGLGVGCNGVIDVLLEPITESYRPAVDAFDAGRDVAILTVLEAADGPLTPGDRAYYYPDDDRLDVPGEGASDISGEGAGDEWPVEAISTPAATAAREGRATVLEIETADEREGDGDRDNEREGERPGRRLEVFVDGLAARPDLVVFGSGHDVGPVVELAENADFRVTVVGFRGGVSLADKYPSADRTVTTSPRAIEDVLDVDDRTYAVVMTHNFVDDLLTVEFLLESPAPYVGLMGPPERFERMRTEFDVAAEFNVAAEFDVAAEGEGKDVEGEKQGTERERRNVSESDLETLYTPVGLDLGGGSPYQIAHSIVAEALAVSNDREPDHLRDRKGPIHDRLDAAVSSRD